MGWQFIDPVDEVRNDLWEESKRAVRIPVAAGARALGAISGLPGDVSSLVNEIARPITKAITGKEALPYEQTYLGKILPTSDRTTEALTPEFAEPRGDVEKFVTETTGDLASLWAGKAATAGTKSAKAVRSIVAPKGSTSQLISDAGKVLASNLASEGVKSLTGDESSGEAAKIGTLFITGLMDKPGAEKFVSSLYKNAEDLLAGVKNQTINFSSQRKNLIGLKKTLSKSKAIAPSEKRVLETVDDILKKTSNGTITAEEAQATVRSLNETLQEAVYSSPDKASKARAKKLFGQVQREFRTAIDDFGSKNPQWHKAYKEANQAFGTLAQSNAITRTMEKVLGRSPKAIDFLKALGVGGGAASYTGVASGVPASILAAGTATAAGAYKTGQVLYRVSKSPALRKHYSNLLKASGQENSLAMIRHFDALMKGVEEEQPKWEFVE